MKSIFRGTTPLLRFEFPFEYKYITKLTVTFAQDGSNLLKINMGDSEIYSIEDFMVTIQLTQEETNQFKHTFPVSAQVKLETEDGEVWAGEVKNYVVHRILDTDIFDTKHDDDESDEES